jgi:hypothetical protein
MTLVFAAILAVHGLIHLLGVAKAFGLAELPQLTQPVTPVYGAFWLAAALLFLTAAVALFAWPRWWWAIGAAAIVVSMVAIVPSWVDARFGAVANVVALAGVAFGLLVQGPASLRARYDEDVARAIVRVDAKPVTEADLAPLPVPVQRYLRGAGVVGRPRVHNFRVRLRGRIRSGPAAPWMPFVAEQLNTIGRPARLFYMTASMRMVPVQGYHRYVDQTASMRIKAAGLVSVVNVSGSQLTRAETVTIFNDMCVMAPATLIDPAIRWEPVDAHTVRATYANAGHMIRAELSFNDAGELIDFSSDDRGQLSADGASIRPARWSTPVSGYRAFGDVRLAGGGAGRWREPAADYAYIELTIDDVLYNVTAP